MKKNVAIAVGVLVVAAAVVAWTWQPWADELPENAAFSVDDEVVTVEDLDRRNDSLRALYGVQEPLEGKRHDTFRRQAAKSMAISMVLDEAVERHEIDVPDGDVDEAMDAYLASQFDGDRDAFIQAVGNVGTSKTAVVDEVERQLALRLLLAEVAGDVEVTDAEVKAAFAERRAELGSPQKRRISNIVVSSKQDARLARQRLDAGEPVAALAGAVSMDAATRDKGGRLGVLARDALVPAVGDAVFSVSPGTAYGPVKGPNGWNVGVVTEVVPSEKAKLGAVDEELRTTLAAEEKQRRWSEWLREELRRSDIAYADEFRPEDPYDLTQWEDPGRRIQPGGEGEQ